jgi:hypothetical protein
MELQWCFAVHDMTTMSSLHIPMSSDDRHKPESLMSLQYVGQSILFAPAASASLRQHVEHASQA